MFLFNNSNVNSWHYLLPWVVGLELWDGNPSHRVIIGWKRHAHRSQLFAGDVAPRTAKILKLQLLPWCRSSGTMAGNGEIENDREQRKRDRAERQRKEREREKESEEGMEGWREGRREGETWRQVPKAVELYRSQYIVLCGRSVKDGFMFQCFYLFWEYVMICWSTSFSLQLCPDTVGKQRMKNLL